MKFLIEKTTTIFSIILLLIAMVTIDWAKMTSSADSIQMGLFSTCASVTGEGSECGSISSVINKGGLSGIDIDMKDVTTCQILTIIAMVALVSSLVCDFVPSCKSKVISPILTLLAGILLIISISIYSSKVAGPTVNADVGGVKATSQKGYSFYLAIAAAVLSSASGLAGLALKN